MGDNFEQDEYYFRDLHRGVLSEKPLEGEMKIAQLASQIARIEGHRSQARIGDIREILAIFADLSYESAEPVQAIIKLGIERAKRKKRSSK